MPSSIESLIVFATVAVSLENCMSAVSCVDTEPISMEQVLKDSVYGSNKFTEEFQRVQAQDVVLQHFWENELNKVKSKAMSGQYKADMSPESNARRLMNFWKIAEKVEEDPLRFVIEASTRETNLLTD